MNPNTKSSPIPMKKSFIQKKKEQEQEQLKRREAIMSESIEFIIMATGCTKMEAYITLQENCGDPLNAIQKMNRLKYC